MKIFNDKIHVDNSELTELQKETLFKSENAMKAFLYPQPAFPEGEYISYWQHNLLIGACRLERHEIDKVVLHPLFTLRAKPHSRTLIELTIAYCLLNQLQPYTFIQTSNKQMNNFVRRLGMFETGSNDQFTGYVAPLDWQPKFIDSFNVRYW